MLTFTMSLRYINLIPKGKQSCENEGQSEVNHCSHAAEAIDRIADSLEIASYAYVISHETCLCGQDLHTLFNNTRLYVNMTCKHNGANDTRLTGYRV